MGGAERERWRHLARRDCQREVGGASAQATRWPQPGTAAAAAAGDHRKQGPTGPSSLRWAHTATRRDSVRVTPPFVTARQQSRRHPTVPISAANHCIHQRCQQTGQRGPPRTLAQRIAATKPHGDFERKQDDSEQIQPPSQCPKRAEEERRPAKALLDLRKSMRRVKVEMLLACHEVQVGRSREFSSLTHFSPSGQATSGPRLNTFASAQTQSLAHRCVTAQAGGDAPRPADLQDISKRSVDKRGQALRMSGRCRSQLRHVRCHDGPPAGRSNVRAEPRRPQQVGIDAHRLAGRSKGTPQLGRHGQDGLPKPR
jgi:hypothetical protein